MFKSKAFAVLAMLPWMWGLLQILVLENFYSMIYMIPYILLIKNSNKDPDRMKTTDTSVDFTLVARKDASTSTEESFSSNNKTSNKTIELNTDNSQSAFLTSNPFLEMTENLGECGYGLNPSDTEAMRHPYQLGNPFLDINESSAALNNEESHRPLLPINPFLQDSVNNPFIDSSFQFPAVFKDQFSNLPLSPRDSDAYCKEWVEKHRKGFIKTLRSFSLH
ncbi:hypothetical protein AVEN_219502-1 [Araneus ventricosus]|uniref:Uncharacterized protein n=1 Tax=Araneus ventricosus TaxID=182803 RepID=A0A4Y2BNW7_ARAVE|nr:hypothetical protein AVEN_219502-1 [Araneus ventricosus]